MNIITHALWFSFAMATLFCHLDLVYVVIAKEFVKCFKYIMTC